MATLHWNTPEGTAEHPLGANTTIGRSVKNDVCIPLPEVSGLHARVVFAGGAWLLEDANSSNGSYVNGEAQTRYELRDGDVIQIGDVDLTFRAQDPHTPSRIITQDDFPKASRRRAELAAEAARLDDLVAEGPRYSYVDSLDSMQYTTAIQPGALEDPAQLSRRLQASYEISRATAATLDPSEILDRVLTALFEIFEQAERAFIVLVDPQSRALSTAAAKRRVAAKAADLPISRTALEQAMEDRHALLCRDAAADERFAQAQSIMSLGIRSMMVAPLVFRDDVLGAVHIDSVTGIREFTQADLELLAIAASQVAGCLANARLHEKVVTSERLAAVGQTVAGLTHCVKNILQGIKGGAFILDRGLQKGDLQRTQNGWEMVKRNNAFMEELVFDLLSYSKQREPEYASADLNALCADICELSAERARSKSVPLTFEPDPALGPVEIDPKGIRRCVLNLVANAVDAGEAAGGAVTVQTRAPGDDGHVAIRIADTGCGMSQETLDKLFTVFFSTKGSKGTGLGLPVTRKIIEEHGGSIDVQSTQGKGTTFTISLPATHAHPQQE